MEKKFILFPSLIIVLSMASACGGQLPIEDQVQTAIAETSIAKAAAETVIAEGIAATFAAMPTNTPTLTYTPTSTFTPTETPTITPTITQTWTPAPTLPPFYVMYSEFCGTNGEILLFTIQNSGGYTFRTWWITVEDENGRKQTNSQADFAVRACYSLGDSVPLSPGSSSTVFVRWSNLVVGLPLQVMVTACTVDNFCYTSGTRFIP